MMNRCMYSSNCPNPMMNYYARPAQRPVQYGECMPKPEEHKREACMEKPRYSRAQMLQHINEVSFAVDDILLYLDTHPCDREALEFYKKNADKRDAALCEFARFYGPLTIDTANEAENDTWEWVMQPWPWEGGNC